MKTIIAMMLTLVVLFGCDHDQRLDVSDDPEFTQRWRLFANEFREQKLLKDNSKLRDQPGLVTYTYLWNESNGKKVFFCESIGYGIPYVKQSANSMAEPNGLFPLAAVEGKLVMCKDPNGKSVKPVYVEPKIIVSPFVLNN